jgi:hypothetical protein
VKILHLKDFAEAWTIMWGLSYIMVALVAPKISGASDALSYAILGGFILFAILLSEIADDQFGYYIVGGILSFLGGAEVFGGVASWSGVAQWNVPFPNKEIFQVSMAFADLLSAVFLILLAIDLFKKK